MLEFALRVAGMYFLALLMIRLLGKRALGELGPFDFVIMTGVGDTVISVALNRTMPFYEGIIVLATLAALEYTMGYLGIKSGRWSNLISGMPIVLIDNGKIIKRNLAREKFNVDDLMQELRKKGIRDINDVEKGILESCGGFSVILKEDREPVTKGDLGLEREERQSLLTVNQLTRSEIFAYEAPTEDGNKTKITDRLQNMEEQLQQIKLLLESRPQP